MPLIGKVCYQFIIWLIWMKADTCLLKLPCIDISSIPKYFYLRYIVPDFIYVIILLYAK